MSEKELQAFKFGIICCSFYIHKWLSSGELNSYLALRKEYCWVDDDIEEHIKNNVIIPCGTIEIEG